MYNPGCFKFFTTTVPAPVLTELSIIIESLTTVLIPKKHFSPMEQNPAIETDGAQKLWDPIVVSCAIVQFRFNIVLLPI